MIHAAPPLPRSTLLLALLACLSFGGLALHLGMDASWDLRNYHYYNGWAFLNGLVGRDVLVAQIPSFFNPALDIPYAWMAERYSARTIAFVLGAVQGLNALLLFVLSWTVLEVLNPNRRYLAALGLTVAGMTGAIGLSEVGTVFQDGLVSLFVLSSTVIVARRWNDLADDSRVRVALLAITAGVPAGLAFGLKQPNVIFCVGLCGAFLIAEMELVRRIWLSFWFGVGVLVGLAIGDGFWLVHLWRTTGNPLFPFFNQIFKSPLGLLDPYRDPGFLQNGPWDKMTFGFRFPFHPELTSEADFRDFRVLSLLIVIPLAAVTRFWPGKREAPLTRPGPSRWLLTAAAITYVLWLQMFCIYRYLLPLEMLTPLLVTAAIGSLPLARHLRQNTVAIIAVLLMLTTIPADWLRVPWTAKPVMVSLPEIEQPEISLVLLSGHEPLSYLIPAFPKSMRFLRIDSTFTLTPPGTGFPKLFKDTIDEHEGPLYSLHIPSEEHDVVVHLSHYGQEIVPKSCREVTSPIGPEAYQLCRLARIAG